MGETSGWGQSPRTPTPPKRLNYLDTSYRKEGEIGVRSTAVGRLGMV